MKNLLLLFFCLMVWQISQAQDIIIKRNGDEISAKILELTPNEIKYKRFDYQEGPTISLLKRDVFMIKYANGTKETFNAPITNTPAYQATGRPGAATDEESIALQTAVKLGGPRLGFTILSGGVADKAKEEIGISPFITQFGWQFETRIFTTGNGLSGLVEFVPLIGGLEQGEFLPSLNALIGLRGSKGFEFGVGPNVSPAGAGLVFAVGTNFQSEGVNFPVNFAVVPGNGGMRFSLLFGFNSRKL
ncbi:hypothetical protein [Rufibacter soli]